MIKDKKGLEMSINTIVIIVIAVTMLILGLVLVRTIMCGAVNLAATTNEGALDQINKLFSESSSEDYTCMGSGTSLMAVIPGKNNLVGCGFKSTTPTTFTYEYKIEYAADSAGNNIQSQVQSWIRDTMTGTVSVTPGMTSMGRILMAIPSDAPEGSIKIKATITKQGGSPRTEYLYLDIKRLGLVQGTVC